MSDTLYPGHFQSLFSGMSSPWLAHDRSAYPKGWTGPKEVDGKQVEGTFRSHQVPVNDFRSEPEHIKIL